jgi:beta-lactamase class D
MSYLCRKFFWMRRVIVVLFLFPVVFFGCSPNNVTVDDSLGRYFDSAGVKGAFGMFDNGHGHFTIYNLSRYSDSFYSPEATFDILMSLVGIQMGVVKDESAKLLPDTVMMLRIGRDTVKKWIDSLQYGNKVTGADAADPFWEDNKLKINCDEQLGLLKKLYFNQLPFFARTQEMVRQMMSSESNSVYRLSYKTAEGKREDGHVIGWVMGWEEENKHPYFFVLNLESADTTRDLRQTGLVIAKKILRQEGFFEGKK